MCLRKDSLGKSDPFLRFSRVNEDGSAIPVFKTEVVKDNLNPTWKPIITTMQRLCNGDPYRPVLLECLDWDKDGSHDLIGSATSSLDDLLRRAGSGERLQLVCQMRKAKVGPTYTNSGLLRSVAVTVTPQPSFLDFVTGGCELNFMVRVCVLWGLPWWVFVAWCACGMPRGLLGGAPSLANVEGAWRGYLVTAMLHHASQVAVDFTGSNGNPTSPSSLHYMNPMGPNQYQLAIQAVGGVLEFYGEVGHCTQ